MKILFRTMRYNWRYIFSKSNKIAVALFSVWGFVTLVTPTDIMLNCIDNVVLRIIVAVLILMVIYFCYSNRGHDLYEAKKTSENF